MYWLVNNIDKNYLKTKTDEKIPNETYIATNFLACQLFSK